MAKATNSKTAPAAATADQKAVTLMGMVDSDKRAKTRRVVIENLTMHPKYGKILRGRTVLHVHDEANESRFGDVVEVVPCRPVSKTKSWKIARIVQKGVGMRFEAVEAPGKD